MVSPGGRAAVAGQPARADHVIAPWRDQISAIEQAPPAAGRARDQRRKGRRWAG